MAAVQKNNKVYANEERKKAKLLELKEIFDITVFKGAAAVIPNAYMTIPNLNREQANLAAIIGYVTQFVNDIDGIEEDLKEKRRTEAGNNLKTQ